MALWQFQMKDHTSNWVTVVSISGLRQTMNGKTYRCVLCYPLCVPLLSVSSSCLACSKVFTRDIYGDHAVSCADIIDGKEVDIGLDVGRTSPLTQTGLTDFVPCRAVSDATHRKHVKYEAKCADMGYDFLPFSFSSFGELEKDAAGTSAGTSNLNLVQHFIDMGFHEKLVTKVIKENGETNTDSILETILTYSVLEDSPEVEHNTCHVSSNQQQCVHYDELSSDYDESLDDSPDASIVDLIQFISASQMAKTEALFFEEEKPKIFVNTKLKRKQDQEALKRNKKKRPLAEQDEVIRLPNPMIGFGVPSISSVVTYRTLPKAAIGPPFFYYENVALATKGDWEKISRFLYEIATEFVDSKFVDSI
ncbi:hypothetical protein Tco_1116032 [Tanacetum coccineum]